MYNYEEARVNINQTRTRINLINKHRQDTIVSLNNNIV
jgi:hypothetical protein